MEVDHLFTITITKDNCVICKRRCKTFKAEVFERPTENPEASLALDVAAIIIVKTSMINKNNRAKGLIRGEVL